MKEEDFIDKLFVANTHDTLLCFSSKGKIYWLKVYRVPQASRGAKGKPIVNLLPLEDDERINAILPIREFTNDAFVFMATKYGTVKKTPLSEFSNQRKGGKKAITLVGDDELVGSTVTNGKEFIMLVSNAGKAAHFSESEVRPMGRSAQGVRGIKLEKDQQVISLIILVACLYFGIEYFCTFSVLFICVCFVVRFSKKGGLQGSPQEIPRKPGGFCQLS